MSFKNKDNAQEDPIKFIVKLVHPKRNISEIDDPSYNNNTKRCRQKVEIEESRDTSKMFSNNTNNAVKTKCQECKNDFTLSLMRCLTKKTHSMTITEYKEKYGELDIIKPVYHKCQSALQS